MLTGKLSQPDVHVREPKRAKLIRVFPITGFMPITLAISHRARRSRSSRLALRLASYVSWSQLASRLPVPILL